MLLTYAALTLTVLTAQQQQTDTTITVNAGTRLELSNPGGDVTVRAWSRNAVQIKARNNIRARCNCDLEVPEVQPSIWATSSCR